MIPTLRAEQPLDLKHPSAAAVLPRLSGFSIFRFSFLLVAAMAACRAARAEPPLDPKNPPQGTFIDEWFNVEMEGAKAGHAHSTVTRDADHITSRTEMKLKIKRGAAGIEIGVDQIQRELLDGTPVGFDNTMVMASIPVHSRGIWSTPISMPAA